MWPLEMWKTGNVPNKLHDLPKEISRQNLKKETILKILSGKEQIQVVTVILS